MSKDTKAIGQLNLDGFKSAVIGASELAEYKITLRELTEIFNLISYNGVFEYAEYIMDCEPSTRAYFTKLNLPDPAAGLAEASMSLDNRSAEPAGRGASSRELAAMS